MIRNRSIACAVVGACWALACGDDDAPSYPLYPDAGAQDAGATTSRGTSSTTRDSTTNSATTSTPDAGATGETQTSQPTTDDASTASSDEPAPADAAPADAATTDPATTDPATTDPATTDPATTDPASSSDTNVSDAGAEDASESTSAETSSDIETSSTDITVEPIADAGEDGGDAESDASTSDDDAGTDASTTGEEDAGDVADASTLDAEPDGFSPPLASCADAPCALNADCTDIVGGYECTCQSGYEGDGTVCEQNCVLAGTCECGNGATEGTEACDDGNQIAGDGCRADCRGTEQCGDGIVDSLTGEQCDDGNDIDNDACDNDCMLAPFVDRGAVLVSDVLACTTAAVHTGRKTATDAAGRLYVLMNCDSDLYVASSSDRGDSWTLPIDTGLTDVEEAAIEGGADGFAYVAGTTGAGDLVLTRTLDSGATWEAARTLDTGISDPLMPELSIDAFGNAVYVAVSTSWSDLRLFRNFALGAGSFEAVNVAMSNAFHDVAVDKVSGKVILMSDDPAFYIRVSSDLGSTFTPEATPAGSASFSDWTGSNGNLYVTGQGTSMYVIPMSAPSTSTAITGLPNTSAYRSVDADALGNAYVASIVGTAVQLDRLVVNTTAVAPADAVTIAASGEAASVSALPNNSGALVAFTVDTGVWAAIEVY